MPSPPTSTPWIPMHQLSAPIPTPVEGKWLKTVGGAMVWSDVISLAGATVSAANVDLPVPNTPIFEFQVTTGGGSIRSIGSWPSVGSARVIIHNWIGSSPITLIAGAGSLPAGQTNLGLRGGLNVTLAVGESVEFWWDGSWREISRNVASSSASGVQVLDKVATVNDVVNTTTVTSFWAKNIPGGTLGTNKMLRVTLMGDYLHNNGGGDTMLLRTFYGSEDLGGTTVAFNSEIGASRQPWKINLVVTAAGATNSQLGYLEMFIRRPGAGDTASPGLGGEQTAFTWTSIITNTPNTQDSTIDQLLSVQVGWNVASVNNSWRFRFGFMEHIG